MKHFLDNGRKNNYNKIVYIFLTTVEKTIIMKFVHVLDNGRKNDYNEMVYMFSFEIRYFM